MFGRKEKNRRLELVSEKLAKGDLLPVSEIDKIVSDPALFDLIRKRIDEAAISAAAPETRSYFGWVPATAFSVAAMAVVGVLASTYINQTNGDGIGPSVVQIEVPGPGPEIARPEIPPKEVFGKLSPGRAIETDAIDPRVEKAAYRKPPARAQRVSSRVDPRPPKAEFYPVAYTGDPAETAGGGRIIRVDIDRSSLFAMGVSVPLENGRETVKADLLIGMDGVTRAIRLVE